MYCVRIFLFIFLLIFTAAAACSSFFPLMHSDSAIYPDIFYWFYQRKEYNGAETVITQSPFSKNVCKETRIYYLITSILSIAGPALGLIGALIAAGFTGNRRRKCCCNCFLFLFSFLAFACCGVCLAFVVYTYMKDLCSKYPLITVEAYKDQGYKLVEGFGLICAACGGYLISALLSLCA